MADVPKLFGKPGSSAAKLDISPDGGECWFWTWGQWGSGFRFPPGEWAATVCQDRQIQWRYTAHCRGAMIAVGTCSRRCDALRALTRELDHLAAGLEGLRGGK